MTRATLLGTFRTVVAGPHRDEFHSCNRYSLQRSEQHNSSTGIVNEHTEHAIPGREGTEFSVRAIVARCT